jgi:SAM-dependent methyltransferase
MSNPVVALGHKVLSIPVCYDAFQTSVGAYAFRESFVRSNVENFKMESVLDLGCGTASTAPLLPKGVQYVGVDTSKKYLNLATKRCQDLEFSLIHSDISDSKWKNETRLKGRTLSLALGIYHHIDDVQLEGTLRNLSESVNPGSRVVSLDPIIDSKTTKVANWFARNDRGKFIRSSDTYAELYERYGFKLKFKILRNEFRIPYDLIIMTAEKS